MTYRNNRLRIVHTPIRFLPAMGGVENHVYYLGKELLKLDQNIEVVCAREPDTTIKNIDGIKVTRLPYWFKVTNTNITPTFPFVLLRKAYDLMHTHMPTPWSCDWSTLVSKIKQKPVVLTIHNDMQKPGFLTKIITDIYLNTVFRITLSLADRIIIVNPNWEQAFHYTKNLLLPYKNKMSVIPNGVDTQLFKPSKKNKEWDILFVSLLDEHHEFKGLQYLLDSVKQLLKTIPNLRVCIVGEGVLKEKYQKKAQIMGISKNISFVGEVAQSNLPNYFQQAKVFVLPSTDTEGYGIVLLESMACGTPVITTSIAGVASDINEHKTGIVIEPKNVEHLTNAIQTILSDNKVYNEMSKNSRKLVRENYSWEKIAQHILKIYINLI